MSSSSLKEKKEDYQSYTEAPTFEAVSREDITNSPSRAFMTFEEEQKLRSTPLSLAHSLTLSLSFHSLLSFCLLFFSSCLSLSLSLSQSNWTLLKLHIFLSIYLFQYVYNIYLFCFKSSRYSTCRRMLAAGQMLRLPIITISTAIIYFHRCYSRGIYIYKWLLGGYKGYQVHYVSVVYFCISHGNNPISCDNPSR